MKLYTDILLDINIKRETTEKIVKDIELYNKKILKELFKKYFISESVRDGVSTMGNIDKFMENMDYRDIHKKDRDYIMQALIFAYYCKKIEEKLKKTNWKFNYGEFDFISISYKYPDEEGFIGESLNYVIKMINNIIQEDIGITEGHSFLTIRKERMFSMLDEYDGNLFIHKIVGNPVDTFKVKTYGIALSDPNSVSLSETTEFDEEDDTVESYE